MSGLNDFRDRHKGQKCYIFGAGPSLNRFDCDKMALDGVTICCNAAIMALKSCDYFLFTDSRVTTERAYYPSVFDKAGTVLIGNQDLYDQCIGEVNPEVRCRVVVPSPCRRAISEGFDFSLHNKGRLIAGGAVEVSTHLAHVMGCSPIILVGVDLCWIDGLKYFYARDDRSLWPSLEEEEDQETDNSLAYSFGLWTQIKAQNPDLPVFVANEQSKLRALYPSMDLSEFAKP